MDISFRQGPAPLHHPATAHLAQTMTLLELTTEELRQKIEAELASNPALELVEERRCPSCRRILNGSATCPVCSLPPNPSSELPIVFVSSRSDFREYPLGFSTEAPEEDYSQISRTEDLPEFVLRQIAPDLQSVDRPIAAHILTSLDEDGLLSIPLHEIARYHHVSIERINQVLKVIQRADPVGVGSPSPQEALLVQLEVLSETRPVPKLAEIAIRQGMHLLSRRRYTELGRLLGISTSQAQTIARFISQNLYPYPGRESWGERGATHVNVDTDNTIYHVPDIVINRINYQKNGPLVVEIAMPITGTLRVNPIFKEALHKAPSDKVEEWQTAFDQASLLVKCLQQRNHTIVRLMQLLSIYQREYILHGDASLKPLTRAQVAKELDVHESTVSRAVSGKAIQLPNGHIVPLSVFFDRSLHIRTALKEIIEQETRPLSDTQIGEILAKKGYPVARRTVAKYRSMEGILPAHLRTSIRNQE